MVSPKDWIGGGWILIGIVLVSGCAERTARSSSPRKSDASLVVPVSVIVSNSAAEANFEEHGPRTATHGGIMIARGPDSSYTEAVFEKGGLLRPETLGSEESRGIDAEKQTLQAFVRAEGDAEAQQFPLEFEPQHGDAVGRASQFVGTLPKRLRGQKLEVTIPNTVISGEMFRLGFISAADEQHDGMPNEVAENEARQLYLTPGGTYTEDDIKANGSMTATAKFKGLKSSHDMSPMQGDKICPVTKIKANPIFAWTIAGKKYQFCCPPCVDEFVKAAKAMPEEIKQPALYKALTVLSFWLWTVVLLASCAFLPAEALLKRLNTN